MRSGHYRSLERTPVGVALGLVVVYLMLSVNVYLESTVFHKFKMAYGKIGPTEARILLIAGNVALVVASAFGILQTAWGEWVINATVFALGTVMFVVLAVRVGNSSGNQR